MFSINFRCFSLHYDDIHSSCFKMAQMVSVLFSFHRAGTKYSVAVFGMFDGGESMPLAGEEKTTLSDAPSNETPIDISGIISAPHFKTSCL